MQFDVGCIVETVCKEDQGDVVHDVATRTRYSNKVYLKIIEREWEKKGALSFP